MELPDWIRDRRQQLHRTAGNLYGSWFDSGTVNDFFLPTCQVSIFWCHCIGEEVTMPDPQCDQNKMLPNFSRYWPKSSQIFFYMKFVLFKIAKKVPEYFGYLCKKFCYQEVQKIAQSGHTEHNGNSRPLFHSFSGLLKQQHNFTTHKWCSPSIQWRDLSSHNH